MDVKNHNLGGVITRSCKGIQNCGCNFAYTKHVEQEFRAVKSKCGNSVLKVRYKHSESRAVWILEVTKGL